ncbi:hypothetical protein BGZ96_000786 [Linnemannia gamsii]|uniref:F-box domain-containing protein n=1 Tax=Linnemannia gamsii TaxID=64522 RepID=A0ABQ7JNH3_9FUNG|nr:hypothetical protein BGZ96_000786 [Linnemannia gamsii]
MLKLACHKFFEAPELVEQLGPFLRPHDLVQLLRTSRGLYAATTLHFWRHVDLEDDHRVDRLITSPSALDALALRAGFIFISYYFEGLMQYLDEHERRGTKSMPSTTTSQIQRPLWLPQPITRTVPARSLPPITRLTQLDISFDRRYRGAHFNNAMRINNAVPILIPLAWLMTLNTIGLKRVTFRHVESFKPLELRCLARTLSKLTSLTHFKIEMPVMFFYTPLLTPAMVFVLFFALPKSMVSFEMEASVMFPRLGDAQEDELMMVQREIVEQGEGGESREASLDWVEGNLVAREGSLENLKVLILPFLILGIHGDNVTRIMEHCPVLESWDIPNIIKGAGDKALYRMIRETVHRQHAQGQESRYLCHLRASQPGAFCNGEGWTDIMDSLPDQHVKSVDFNRYLDAHPDKFVPALLRHSETLRSVVLKNSQRIGSRTLAAILGRCHGLETFWATMAEKEYGKEYVALALNHAIEQEWACQGIKSLRFTVDLAVQEYSGTTTSRGGGVGSTATATPSGLFNVDLLPKKQWQKLGVFYTQLGKLVELEDLEIFVAPPPMEETYIPADIIPQSYPSRSLTGLLSLEEEDKETGKRGFLSLLGGLKKLRVVQGCFRTETVETIETFGQREAEWVLENWPALETIEFLPEGHGSLDEVSMPKHLQGLRQKKPSLKLCR